MLKNKIIKFDSKIYTIEKYTIFALLMLMFLFSTVQIFLRIFFNKPIAELEIIIREIVMIGCLLSASISTYHISHFKIELLDKLLKKDHHKKLIRAIGHLFILISALIIAYQSIKFIEIDKGFTSILKEISQMRLQSLPLLFFPLIFINMAVHSFVNMIKEE